MASLRGVTTIWSAHALTTNDVSGIAIPGPGPHVAVFIQNTGSASATFQIQAAVSLSQEAGRNALSNAADGGLPWFPYASKLNSTPFSLVVAAGTSICLDLAPFAPEFIRLICTAATAGANVTAYVSSFGPN